MFNYINYIFNINIYVYSRTILEIRRDVCFLHAPWGFTIIVLPLFPFAFLLDPIENLKSLFKVVKSWVFSGRKFLFFFSIESMLHCDLGLNDTLIDYFKDKKQNNLSVMAEYLYSFWKKIWFCFANNEIKITYT